MLIWVLVGFAGLMVLFLSRAALLKPGSHGFWRFFAFELILGLAGLNLEGWFSHPWDWQQIISWFLLFLSLVPLVMGVIALKKMGKPTKTRPGDESLFAFEKTSALVTTGIYHYIRHPLYTSLLLLTWGIFFKQPSWLGGILGLLITFFILMTATADEKECLQFFGQDYQDYMKVTKRFIPRVF